MKLLSNFFFYYLQLFSYFKLLNLIFLCKFKKKALKKLNMHHDFPKISQIFFLNNRKKIFKTNNQNNF